MKSTMIFLILLFSCLCRDSWGVKPLIRPSDSEIIKRPGQSIIFECLNPSKIFFYYPEYKANGGQRMVTSMQEKKDSLAESGSTYSVFFRRNPAPTDTGWYGCSEHNVTITPKIFHDPRFSWIYFYVQSLDRLLIDEDEYEIITEDEGKTAILPCRPTSPYLKVELYDYLRRKKIEVEGNVSYDPKFGFEFSYVTITDAKYYKCEATMTGKKQKLIYFLNVQRGKNMNNPRIDESALKRAIRGQDLHVNCTIYVKGNAKFLLDWDTPHTNPRISTKMRSIFKSGNYTKILINELTIKNMSEIDEGKYRCYVKPRSEAKEARIYLKINVSKTKYLDLIPKDVDMYAQRPFGSNIMWTVSIEAYPEPEITWLHPNGDTIVSDEKYTIQTKPSYTSLNINRLDVTDIGVYEVLGTNDDNIRKSLYFTLEVLAEPVPILKNIQEYYAPGENANIQCEISAFPQPNITWTFLRCPHYPSMESSSLIKLKSETDQLKSYAFWSKTSLEIDVSGIINCITCNSIGCKNKSEEILVSDGNGDFGILEPKEKIIEGDSVSIVCAASIYKYDKVTRWFKSNSNVPIVDNENINVVREQTPFTYRLILYIRNVRKEDSYLYSCIAETKLKMLKVVSYHLIVDGKKPPIFINSSLNGRDLSIDLGKERHKVITLMCYVDGRPEPVVTWYKDDVTLTKEMIKDKYEYHNKSQELQINYLREKDSGKYSCRATNRFDTIEDFINIVIKERTFSVELIYTIAILLVVVVILVIFFTIKVRREKILRKELLESGLMHFEEGALDSLNPDLTVDDQAELLPYDKKWEFPRERLKLGRQIGSGAFGMVMKAEAVGICENKPLTTVAVKMVRRTTEPTYVRALASELKIMVHLGRHLNVVNLLGACTKNISKRELLVIVEYCPFGNVQNYMLKRRTHFINQIDPVTGKIDFMIGNELVNSEAQIIPYEKRNTSDSAGFSLPSDDCTLSDNSTQPGWRSNYRGDYQNLNLKPLCTQDLLSWAFQVARGMEYLSQRNVLHGDLAARNILLAEDNVVKICDFGLAKSMYKDDNYLKTGNEPLPVKWMAIESIRDRIFSTQSDVWSFGVVLWEFFTLAVTPYPGMPTAETYQKLIQGYRMEQPEYSTDEVYRIILQCWKSTPTFRPNFTELVKSIGDLLEESVKAHYISLNAPYMDMNEMNLKGKDDYLTMMAAPDHEEHSSPTNDYVNLLKIEESVELSPMLQKEEDPYLKPINIHVNKI